MQRQQADEKIVSGARVPADCSHVELRIRLLSKLLDNNLILKTSQDIPGSTQVFLEGQ
jgi:hypothetical protein